MTADLDNVVNLSFGAGRPLVDIIDAVDSRIGHDLRREISLAIIPKKDKRRSGAIWYQPGTMPYTPVHELSDLRYRKNNDTVTQGTGIDDLVCSASLRTSSYLGDNFADEIRGELETGDFYRNLLWDHDQNSARSSLSYIETTITAQGNTPSTESATYALLSNVLDEVYQTHPSFEDGMLVWRPVLRDSDAGPGASAQLIGDAVVVRLYTDKLSGNQSAGELEVLALAVGARYLTGRREVSTSGILRPPSAILEIQGRSSVAQ